MTWVTYVRGLSIAATFAALIARWVFHNPWWYLGFAVWGILAVVILFALGMGWTKDSFVEVHQPPSADIEK